MEMAAENFETLARDIRDCRLCSGRFRATATGHAPRPVFWVAPGARIPISGQAPGARVHASGQPFTARSGARLRAWLGLDEGTFYDRSRVAILAHTQSMGRGGSRARPARPGARDLEMTPLDEALGAMRADPEADRLRRAYFDRLSLVDLFLLLDA